MHVINTYYSLCLPSFYLSFQLYRYLVIYPPIIIQVYHVSMIYLLAISFFTNLLSATLHIFLSHMSFIHHLSFRDVTYQGGHPRGQHDGVHGFPEPVKLFITFEILSQISCGKVRKTLIFFCTRLYQSFSWVCCSFKDYLEQLKKKQKILLNLVHTSVGRGDLENCSEHRRNFHTVLCRKI